MKEGQPAPAIAAAPTKGSTSLFRSIAYSSLLAVANAVFPLAMLMWVSRRIGAENVGRVNWAISFAAYFVLFATFGIGTYGTRQIARVRKDKARLDAIFSQLLSFSLVAAGLGTVAYVAIVLSVPSLLRYPGLFASTGLMIALAPFSLDWFFQGLENFKFIAIRSISIKLLTLLLMVVFVRDPGDYVLYALLFSLGITLNGILNFRRARRFAVFRFSLRGLLATARPLLRFALISLAVSLYMGLDKIILGAVSGYTSVGYYIPAEKVVRTAIGLLTAICAVMLPRFSLAFSGTEDGDALSVMAGNSMHANLFLAIPMTAGILLLSSPIAFSFGGSDFLPSAEVLRVMACIIIPVSVANVSGVQILIASGRERGYLSCVLAGTAVFLAVASLAIPSQGARGAAIAMVCAESAGALLESLLARKYLRGSFAFRRYLPIMVATAIMTLAVSMILRRPMRTSIALVMASGGGAATYFASALLLRDAIALRILDTVRSHIQR
jgi:O-antigen/teichoic acid export membrane protein